MSTAVDVWRVALDATRPPAAALISELSEAERARAARFATDALRNRWFAAHVALRRILAARLDVPPATISYSTGANGKPQLASPAGTALEFNLSDSDGYALIAVSFGGAVGADVERRRPLPDLLTLARRYFAESEQTALLELPAAEQHAAYYRLWTRKEAYLKALGAGLSYGLARFAVTASAADARLLVADGDHDVGRRWRIEPITVADDYEACVAAPWRFDDLRVHDFPTSGDGSLAS